MFHSSGNATLKKICKFFVHILPYFHPIKILTPVIQKCSKWSSWSGSCLRTKQLSVHSRISKVSSRKLQIKTFIHLIRVQKY